MTVMRLFGSRVCVRALHSSELASTRTCENGGYSTELCGKSSLEGRSGENKIKRTGGKSLDSEC